jgi:hypothetical protein
MVARTYPKTGYTTYVCDGSGELHGSELPREQRAGVTRPSVSSKDLDSVVWEHVSRMLVEPGFLEEALRLQADEDRTEMDLAAIDRRLADVNYAMDNLALAMTTANRAVIAILTHQINTLTEQHEHLEQEREHVLRRAANALRARDVVENMHRALGQLPEAIDAMPYAKRREILQALCIRVTVGQRTAARKWGLPPWHIDSDLAGVVDSDKSKLSLDPQSARLSWDFVGGRLAV